MNFSNQAWLRTAAIFGLFVTALSGNRAFSQCRPTNEKTAWGGHSPGRLREPAPMRDVHGIVKSLDDKPLNGVLVEVYDHPEVLDVDSTPTRTGQRRIAGCITDKTGTFTLSVLPGHYEVRELVRPQ